MKKIRSSITTVTAESETMLKEIPMLSVDGIEIKVNTILYRTSWESGYNFQGTAKAEAK